ncbi:hypothetical protein RSP795_17500 [Ralstonia solanacearum]|nr:hypothetical protein RSP795_17500 [Ralstonia solanacearum]
MVFEQQVLVQREYRIKPDEKRPHEFAEMLMKFEVSAVEETSIHVFEHARDGEHEVLQARAVRLWICAIRALQVSQGVFETTGGLVPPQ